MLDLTSPAQVADLLRRGGLKPRKRWGQHFLCDRNILERIVGEAGILPDSRILEIGPGLGVLTRRLADLAAFVTSVEIDPKLVNLLHETLDDKPNVKVISQDFMKLNHADLLTEAFGDTPGLVVANIPYNITTPILEVLLAHKEQIQRVVLLVQKELADRLAASPGNKDYGSLSLFAQFHARVRKGAVVPPTVFFPPPQVSSAIVVLEPVAGGTVSVRSEERFFAVVHAAFGQRRKTLATALVNQLPEDREHFELALSAAGIDGRRRGETLTLHEFAALSDALTEL